MPSTNGAIFDELNPGSRFHGAAITMAIDASVRWRWLQEGMVVAIAVFALALMAPPRPELATASAMSGSWGSACPTVLRLAAQAGCLCYESGV
jgi:hypothetical protein